MATEYEGSVEQVHRAFREERYWMTRLTESGADAYTLDRLILAEDGGIDIVTTQTILASRLPGVVQQFHRGDLSFVREETWTPVKGGRANAAVRGLYHPRSRNAPRRGRPVAYRIRPRLATGGQCHR